MNELTIQRVAAVLLKHPETRDNDRMLCVYYWQQQIIDSGRNPSNMDLSDFFLAYTFTDLTDAQTITRLRRKLQMERTQFRGKRWEDKQRKQLEVQLDLGYGQTLDDSRGGHTP
jgi:hypothetical protein